MASRARTTETVASANTSLQASTWKLDAGPSNSAMSNYFPARSLRGSSTRSGAQWETRSIPTALQMVATPAETERAISILNKTPLIPQAPLHTPRDEQKPFSALHALNDAYILQITSAGCHENVSTINLNGKRFDVVDRSNFERFGSCAFIQASRTQASVNLDTFEKLASLTDLEINMAGVTRLVQPTVIPSWSLAILDLSYNSLSQHINDNIRILATIPKLRVLNVSGNDLTNLGTLDQPVHFPSLQLFIAEDNRLTLHVFQQLATTVQIPNLKVLLLDFNKIGGIPRIDTVPAESAGNPAYENGITTSLAILSLAGNPIRYFENFSNVLQFEDLEVLKLQDTPFVKNTSKNPKVVDDSRITVERHYKKKDLKKLHRMGAKIKARKVQEPERHKRDKTWFYELIENLEKRVKYKVRSAILGEKSSEMEENRLAEKKTNVKKDQPRQGDPVFLTELDADLDADLASTIGSDNDDSQSQASTACTDQSIISDTITDMSILNGSEAPSTRSLTTPPLPISESVKRLKMAFQKQTMFHQNHGLAKFPYHGGPKAKSLISLKSNLQPSVNCKTVSICTNKLQQLATTEDRVLEESLAEMRDLEAEALGKLTLKNTSDMELYSDIKDEYEKLRLEINNMSVDTTSMSLEE